MEKEFRIVVGRDYDIVNTDMGLAEAVSSQSGIDYLKALEEGGFEDVDPYLAERGLAEKILKEKGIPRVSKRTSKFDFIGFYDEMSSRRVNIDNVLADTQVKQKGLVKYGYRMLIGQGNTRVDIYNAGPGRIGAVARNAYYSGKKRKNQ